MNRTTLVSLVAIASASVAIGLAPVANAASPRAHVAHGSYGHGQPGKGVPKVDRRLSMAKSLATAEIGRKDAALARATSSPLLAKVAPADADTVRAAVAADRDNLVTLRNAVAAAATLPDVAVVAAQVAPVRPETYNVVLGALLVVAKQQATLVEHQAQSDDLAAQADALEAQGSDVTAVRDALAAAADADAVAADAATTAHDLALALTATSSLQARSAVGRQLVAVGVALVTANTQLALAQQELDALSGPTA